jgi:hypothetical protein
MPHAGANPQNEIILWINDRSRDPDTLCFAKAALILLIQLALNEHPPKSEARA